MNPLRIRKRTNLFIFHDQLKRKLFLPRGFLQNLTQKQSEIPRHVPNSTLLKINQKSLILLDQDIMILKIPMADSQRNRIRRKPLHFFPNLKSLFKKVGVVLHEQNFKIRLLASCLQKTPDLLQLPGTAVELQYRAFRYFYWCIPLLPELRLMKLRQRPNCLIAVLGILQITFPAGKICLKDIDRPIKVHSQKLSIFILKELFCRKLLSMKKLKNLILQKDFVSSFHIFFKNQHSLICFTKNSAPPLRGAKHFYIIIVKQRNASVVHIQSP